VKTACIKGYYRDDRNLTYLKMKLNYTVKPSNLTSSMTLDLQEIREKVNFFRKNEEGSKNLFLGIEIGRGFKKFGSNTLINI